MVLSRRGWVLRAIRLISRGVSSHSSRIVGHILNDRVGQASEVVSVRRKSSIHVAISRKHAPPTPELWRQLAQEILALEGERQVALTGLRPTRYPQRQRVEGYVELL